MADVTEVVPLPDYLKECGCLHAKAGMHATTCRVAREFDAIPLSEREGYAPGRRFRTVSWVFPLELHAKIDVTVEVDPVLFIAAHRLDYDAFELDDGYEEWEKPIVFLTSIMDEDFDQSGMTRFDHGRHISRTRCQMDDTSESPRWTPEHTAHLDELLAKQQPVDPNQPGLFGDTEADHD